MQVEDISYLRLRTQNISSPLTGGPKDLVSRMGAMQAQDFSMAKWAVGLRTKGATEVSVEEALNGGEILRTHLMRPTWHFVSSDDIYWLLALTAPRLKASLASRQKRLEITPETIRKSNDLITSTISRNGHSTREELAMALKGQGFSVADNRGSHLLIVAELDGLICSGQVRKNKPTYALLEERVPRKKILSRDEALATLAGKYFSSHGPAKIADFAWWSGLTMKEATRGLDMVKADMERMNAGEREFWMLHSEDPRPERDSVYFLPAYDEFIISYRDRSMIIADKEHLKITSANGMFWPLIVVDGKIVGLWKRKVNGDSVSIEIRYFDSIPESRKHRINKEPPHMPLLSVKNRRSADPKCRLNRTEFRLQPKIFLNLFSKPGHLTSLLPWIPLSAPLDPNSPGMLTKRSANPVNDSLRRTFIFMV